MVKRAFGTFCALVLTVAFGLAGPAQAGNGNGNGNGNANGKSDSAPAEQSATPGNSGDAPGHNKDAAAPAEPKQSGPDTKQSGPDTKQSGPDKKSSAPAQDAAPAPTSGPSEGVKPSNSTAKHTNEQAGSNKTKLYGNGKTAGQIAISHGYPASGNVYGPGNSQPHKVVPCGGRHGVDVHALKSHPAKSCGSSPSTPSHKPDPQPTKEQPAVTPHDPRHDPVSLSPASVEKPANDPGKHDVGDVADGGSAVHAMSGALAATAAVGPTLPFTGFPLWAVAIVALALIGAGLSLRRLAEAKNR